MMIRLLTSFTGSLGFCLVFHLRRRYLLPASLGSVLTCGVYLAAASTLDGITAQIDANRVETPVLAKWWQEVCNEDNSL